MNTIQLSSAPMRHKSNAVELVQSVMVQVPVEFAFEFMVKRIPDYYTKIASGHHKFEILDGDEIKLGIKIDCEESAGNQTVHHHYVVKQLIVNQHIYYESCPSKGILQMNNRQIETISNTFVYYDFEALSPDKMRLSASIIIQLPNLFTKFLAMMSGTRSTWKQHLDEELLGAKHNIEQLWSVQGA